nr:uncharacterized protein LOC109173786 [Ipomoea batatas]
MAPGCTPIWKEKGEWLEFATEHKRPRQSRALDDATLKISAEEYEYEVFRSPKEYLEANLEPHRYDLREKYTPKRAEVTIAVGPPPPEAGSQEGRALEASGFYRRGASCRRSTSDRDPPRRSKRRIGRKRATKRGKEKEVLEVEEVAIVKSSRRDGSGSTTPVIDVLMKHGDESPAALLTRICATAPPPEKTSGWSTALVGERIARDLIQIPSFWPSISAEDGRLGRPFLREIGHLTPEVSTLLSPSRSEDQ